MSEWRSKWPLIKDQPFVSCRFRQILELVSCRRLICSSNVPRIRPFWSADIGALLLDRLRCLGCCGSDKDPETPVPDDPELDEEALLWLLSPPGSRLDPLFLPPPLLLTFSLSEPPGSLLNLQSRPRFYSPLCL